MANSVTTGIALLLFFVTGALYLRPRRHRNPPGPKPLPVIGNLLDFPVYKPWLTYDKWKKQYGDVIYMNVLGTPIVILNSLQACNDLFEKRSAKYSSRPRLVMLVELMGWGWNFALMPYSPRWRKYRRLFHQHFNENMAQEHRHAQQQDTYIFLQRLHQEPGRLFDHIRYLFGKTMTEMMYGVKIHGPDDSLLRLSEATVASAMRPTVPGQYLVDVFPLLKHIPSWLPGAGFKRQAAVWKILADKMASTPFVQAKELMTSGTSGPSVVMSMLSRYEETLKGTEETGETTDEVVQGCAAIAYLAGADTSFSATQAFFIAMANHPEVQKAAQIELDALLGESRLPTFEDSKDLPFVQAVIKELLRWHNPAPLAIAHCLSEDDEYNGYHLPKGTIVFGNTWSILHDPEVYPEPLSFNPWRWILDTPEGIKMNESIPDSGLAAFGFGRRVCPGRHFASNALFITIASILTCFDIRPLDSNRQPTDRVEEAFTSGFISYPEPFNVSFKFRSDKMGQLLKDSIDL